MSSSETQGWCPCVNCPACTALRRCQRSGKPLDLPKLPSNFQVDTCRSCGTPILNYDKVDTDPDTGQKEHWDCSKHPHVAPQQRQLRASREAASSTKVDPIPDPTQE